jgi:hypothetical protein
MSPACIVAPPAGNRGNGKTGKVPCRRSGEEQVEKRTFIQICFLLKANRYQTAVP